MDDFTFYARAELIAILPDDPIPDGHWVTDFSWNTQDKDLIEWVSQQPENFRFRAIAFEPGNKKENN